VDANGKQLITNLQTSTVLKRTSVLSRCTSEAVEASIAEILTVDMFLGLVGEDEIFGDSLVKHLDVTRQTTPSNMRRDISSKASNFMTMLHHDHTKISKNTSFLALFHQRFEGAAGKKNCT